MKITFSSTLAQVGIILVSTIVFGSHGFAFDVGSDGQEGLPEAIHALQVAAGLTPNSDTVGNAETTDVLAGKTFTNYSGAATGTMVNRGAVTVTPGSSDQPIPEGYHNGSGKVTAMATTGTAVPADVLAGKTFMNSSGATTGTMTTRGAVTITPGTSDKPILEGHHNGSGKVTGDPDLASGNIKAGTNIFGVTGNSNVVDTSSGDATAQQLLVGKIAHVDGNQIVGTRPKIYGCLPPAFPPPINWNISQCQNDCLANLHTFGDPTHCIALCDNLALIPDVVTQLCQL